MGDIVRTVVGKVRSVTKDEHVTNPAMADAFHANGRVRPNNLYPRRARGSVEIDEHASADTPPFRLAESAVDLMRICEAADKALLTLCIVRVGKWDWAQDRDALPHASQF